MMLEMRVSDDESYFRIEGVEPHDLDFQAAARVINGMNELDLFESKSFFERFVDGLDDLAGDEAVDDLGGKWSTQYDAEESDLTDNEFVSDESDAEESDAEQPNESTWPEGEELTRIDRERPLRYQVLDAVQREPNRTGPEIADDLDESPSTVWGRLHGLYDRDMVSRQGKGKPGHPYRYFITDFGRRTIRMYQSQFARGLENLPDGWVEENQ